MLPLTRTVWGVRPSDNSFALVDISSPSLRTSNSQGLRLRATRSSFGFYGIVGALLTDNSFALVDISSTISTDVKFLGAATASNGKIIPPYAADGVGVFDPTDNNYSLVDVKLDHLYRLQIPRAATASNGKIIFAPNDADAVGVFQAVHPPCDYTAPTNRGVVAAPARGRISCQPTCDEGYSVTGTSSCIAGTLTATLCLTTCSSRVHSLTFAASRHASRAGIGVGHSAFCKISGISGSADCPLIGRINRIMVVRAAVHTQPFDEVR